jgi:glycine cleavage system H protein
VDKMSIDIDSLKLPDDVRYTKTSEWARAKDAVVTVGITDYAQSELSDIVYVEMPKLGAKVQQGKECGVVESVKAASDFFAPVSGEVVEVNKLLADSPEMMNKDPYGEGWFIRVKASNAKELAGLMDLAAYKKFLKEEAGHH